MAPAPVQPSFHITTSAAADLDVDVLVVLFHSVATGPDLGPEGPEPKLDPATRAMLRPDAADLVSTHTDAVTWLETTNARAPRALLVHFGQRATVGPAAGFHGGVDARQRTLHRRHELRVLGANIERACVEAGVTAVGILGFERDEDVLLLAEGMLLRGHSPRAWEEEPPAPSLQRILLRVPERHRDALQEQWHGVEVAARHTNVARSLADLPSNIGTPRGIAARVRTRARALGLSHQQIGRARARELGMGLFAGVDRGAGNEGVIVVLEHNRARRDELPTLALAGKGICHDTGGYNLKTSSDLHRLTYDKCGAAAVFGAMFAIAELDLPLHVIAACPLAENLIDADAYKPGDVLKAYDGTTVYIENTDAEGRLVLADALAWLDEQEPDLIIDVATLTGAAHVALGEPFAALFTNDDDARRLVTAAADRAGELVWSMPIHEIHDRELAHPKADLKNLGVRGGGACSAAAFLRHFVDTRWAHIDIAGKAHTDFARDYYGPGATGFGTRLLVDVAARFAEQWEIA